MKKTKNSAWKRVAAGSLSMALVAGAMPANVGGFLTGGNALVANAEDYEGLSHEKVYLFEDTITFTGYIKATTQWGNSFDPSLEKTVYIDNQRMTVGPRLADDWDTTTGYYWGTELKDGGDYLRLYCPLKTGMTDDNIKGLKVIGAGTESDPYIFKMAYYVVSPTVTANTLTSTGSSQALVTAPTDAGIHYRYKKSTDNNYSNWSTTVPSAADAGTYSIQWYTEGNEDYLGSGSEENPNQVDVTIGKANLSAGTDYTVPTAVAGLSYDGEEHALVTGGMTEAGAAKGTMKYAFSRVITSDINFNDLAVNDILKIGDNGRLSISNINSISISNINSTVLSENTYESNDNNVITIFDDDYLYINNNNTAIDFTGESGAAIKVTGIDREQGIVNAQLVGENTDLEWSTNVPNATNAGTYSVSWRITGAEGYNDVAPQTIPVTIAKGTLAEKHIDATTQEIVGDYVAPTAAKTLKTAATDTEPAEYYDDLFYTGDAVDLINEGTVDDGKGTMQYVLGTVHTINENTTINCEDICLGDIFYFPANVESAEVTISGENPNFYHNYARFFKDGGYVGEQAADGSGGWGSANNYNCIYSYTYGTSEGPKYYFTSGYYNPETGALTPSKTSTENRRNWSESVPTGNKAGKYNIAWRIAGNDNYNPVGGVIENEIKAKPAALVLSNLDGAVITKEDGTVIDADDTGNYTVTGGKYYLYSDKTVAGADTTSSIAKLVGKNQTFAGTQFANKYEFTIPTLPADDGYTFSHTNNWTGAVNNNKKSKLYVADGAVDTNNEAQLAAILQSTGKLYYGDEPTVENVDIKAGFGNLITVKDIYLSNEKGTKLDLTSGTVTFGDYKLTAEIIVDNDGDGDFETGVNDQQICTLYADIEYAARPMSENKYFLVTDNPEFNTEQAESATNKKYIETQLEVVQDTDNENNPIVGQYSVIVPETTFAYNGTAKKPEIVVKNGGNSAVLTASAPAQGTTAAVAGDYASSIEAKTNAGDYSFELTAAANTNYTDKVAVKWSIAKAKVNVNVNAKANLTYDGAVLDASDFEFTAAQNDTLAQQVIAEMTKAEGETAPKTNITVTPITENLHYTPKTDINNDNVGYYLYDTPFNQYYYHYINIGGLDQGAYIKLPGMNDPIPASQASSIDFNTTPYNFVIEKGGTLEYWFNGHIYSTPLTAGNGWYLQKTIQNVSVGSDQTESRTVYEVVQKALPTKTYDLKNAGIQKAKITITNPNIDVVVNNGSSVTATIAKKKVTITPKADQKAVFGDIKTVDDVNSTVDDKFFVPEYTFDGVVDADKAIITTFGDILDVKYNKIAVGETKADVTTYGNTEQYEAVEIFGDALAQSNKILGASDYNLPAQLNGLGTRNTTITIPDNTAAGYTFNYYDCTECIKIKKTEGDIDFYGSFTIDNNGNLTYSKADNGAWVATTVPLTAGNVWVVTGELYTADEIATDADLTGKYKSIEIKQITPENVDTDFVNAGTYEFVLEKNDDGANYQFELAQNAPTYAIEQKSLKSEDIALTVSEPSYTYDGTKKIAPDDYVITDAKIGTLTKDTDFEVGGQTAAVLPNTYDLEFSGLNNYKDMIKSQWEIKSDTTYDITVSVEDKTYDGTTIVPTFAYTQKNPNFDSAQPAGEENPERINITEADLPKNTKTTLTYYKLANNTAVPQTTEELAALNLTALEGAPKDAGKYVVVAKTTARGYVFRDCIDNFEIKQREIEVIPTITSVEYGKFDTSDITKYTYSTDNIINGDTVNVTGQLAGIYAPQEDITKYGYKVGVYNYAVPTPEEYATIPAEYKDLIIHVDNPNYKLATNAKLTVTQCEIKDDDIKVTGKCVAGADGWAYPNSCVKVVVSLYNVETKQYEEVELTEGTDFDITSATKTKQLGEFNVEVEGKGNYTTDPVAVAAVDVVTEAYLNDFVKISEPFASVNSSGVGRVSATFTHEIPEGYTVTESGILYVKDANCATDLTLKNEGTAGIGKKVNTVTGSTSQTLNVTDPNGVGAKMRGYMIVAKGNNTYTVYTDEISATYAELAIKNATNIDISAPKATVNASGKGRVSATFTHEVANGFTVTESGILYVKDANCATDLTLDNVGNSGIGKKVNTVAGSTSQTLNVTDPDGNGAKMRGYVIVTDGNISKTLYTDEVSGTYIDLAFSDAVSVNISAPKATVNASGTGRVSATFTYEAADGYTVTESGMLYVKNADCATELTLDNVGNSGIGKKVNTVESSTSQTLNVTDPNGNGAKMRGYVTVTDGATTKTIYTDEISGKYAELSAQ